MKKKFNQLAGVLICIFFAIFLLFLKDKVDVIWDAICNFATILTPFIYGFGIAYIMNFPYKFIRNKVFANMNGKNTAKLAKPISICLSYILAFGIITAFFAILIPVLTDNINILLDNLSGYVNVFTENLDSFIVWLDDTFHIKFDNINNIIHQLLSYLNVDNIKSATEIVLPFITGSAKAVYNWIIGIIVSIYFLSSKEFLYIQLKRFCAAFLPTKWMPTIYRIVNVADNKCGKFLVGQILDSSLVGILVFIVMSLLNTPYAPLISVIVGVTNLIPFFGPFIGAIPSALLLLFISPIESLKFIILVIVVQQIDSNILVPKIVGSQVGLSGIWSLFAVIVAGGLFGVVGMILGTPIFATIYTLLGDKIESRVAMKGENAQKVINMSVINSHNLTNIKKKTKKKDNIKSKNCNENKKS